MNIEEFAKLKVGEYVTVKPWEDVANIAPVEMKRFCDKRLRVRSIDFTRKYVLLEDEDRSVLDRLFSCEMLKSVNMGTLYYHVTGNSCGDIGKKTKMSDFDGMALYVGDVVNVRYIKKKEDREELKKAEEKLREFGFGDMAKVIVSEVADKTMDKVHTAVVIENDGMAFVCGIQIGYNEKEQKTDEWEVTKIIDHSAVRNGAIINHIEFRRGL